jgi:pyruvate formate lyase activating enzyme
MGVKGRVFDIKRYAIHDGPGIRTTIFFKGCPLRCPWCHNPEGLEPEAQLMWWEGRCLGCRACEEACPRDAVSLSDRGLRVDDGRCDMCGECAAACYPRALELVGKQVSVEEAMREIEKDRVFYDQSGGGATFSGGEPLMQPQFLKDLLKDCKSRGIHTAVDTSGCVEPEVLASLAAHVDLFLYDIKIMDDEAHRRVTGASNRIILQNLKSLAERGNSVSVRVSVVPGVNDSAENIDGLGAFVASLGSARDIHLLPYHRVGVEKAGRLRGAEESHIYQAPSPENLERICERLSKYPLRARVGG